jgi:6,7-dimethyl-8-ribityllumazine synthase
VSEKGVGSLTLPDGCRSPEPAEPPGEVAVIASRFNAEIVQALLDGAVARLAERGLPPERVTVVTVPGAFELPLACDAAARSGRYGALVALGCVIRGETSHYDYVCAESARGIADVARAHGIPVGFGVLTVEDAAQAWARAGGAVGNAGASAADAAVDMAALLAALRGASCRLGGEA